MSTSIANVSPIQVSHRFVIMGFSIAYILSVAQNSDCLRQPLVPSCSIRDQFLTQAILNDGPLSWGSADAQSTPHLYGCIPDGTGQQHWYIRI